VEEADVRVSATGQLGIYNGTDNVTFNHDGNDLLVNGTATATMEFVDLPVQLDDSVALQFGTGNDIQMSWDTVDIEITSALANPTWNFRDGHHLRLWDSTDTDYVDFHHDGTDFNIAAGTTTDINFTGLTAINTNANVIALRSAQPLASSISRPRAGLPLSMLA
jgi:hypothetical protein